MSDDFNTYPDPVCGAFFIAMKRKGITIPNVTVKDGKVIVKPPRMSVSKRIAVSKSKRVRVTRKTKGAQRP